MQTIFCKTLDKPRQICDSKYIEQHRGRKQMTEKELQAMSAKDVLQYAKQQKIHIPASCKAKPKAIKCIMFSLYGAIDDLNAISNF